jgi:hypothetical protein
MSMIRSVEAPGILKANGWMTIKVTTLARDPAGSRRLCRMVEVTD